VRIGVAIPDRPGMAAITQGAELALETLAADPRARALGVRFALRVTPPAVRSAVAAAERLRDDPAVIGIVGDAESGRTLDALPVIEDAAGDGARALVAITPTATSPALAGRSPWLFRLSPGDDAASRHVATYARTALGARRAAVVYRADSYGRDWAAAFVRAFVADGGAVVARDPYLRGVTDWPIYARALAGARPDVVLFPGSANDAAALLRALRAAGVSAPLIGGDAVAPLADSAEFAGARYAATFTAEWAASAAAPPAARAFAARYRARFGERPGVRAALGYEAALLLGQAALAVDLGAPDRRRRVRDHLVALGRTAPHADGVIGPVAFDARHGVAARAVLVATVAGPAR
jgi:branched-chain amino acid transport system substrate-binding protein